MFDNRNKLLEFDILGRTATRLITERVHQLLLGSGVPFVRLKSPVAVRTYPPEAYQSIRIQDFFNPRIFTEEFAVKSEWLDDASDLDDFVARWDRRFTLFLYTVVERFEFTPGKPEDVLDEMAVWLRIPKIRIQMYRHELNDSEWNTYAVSRVRTLMKKLGMS